MAYRTHILRWLKILFPFIFLLVIVYQGRKQLNGFEPADLLVQLQSFSAGQIISMMLLGLCAVALLMFYDVVLAGKVLQLSIRKRKLMKISWITVTFNSVLGFGGLGGASLRQMFYKLHTDVEGSRLLAAIVWMVPLTPTGLSLLSWLAVLSIVPIGPIIEHYGWLQYVIWGMAAYTPARVLFALFGRKKGGLQKMALVVAVSTVEWLAAATTLWGIANILGNKVPFLEMLAVFIAGAVAGVISLVPGGLGSFDLIVMVGMGHFGIANNKILAILFCYRFFYYIFPFLLGLILASTEVVSQTKNVLASNKYRKQFRWIKALPDFLISNLSNWALSVLVFFSGLILLFSASAPGTLGRTVFAEKLFSTPFLQLSHQLSVISGVSLLFLSRYIYLKEKSAYTLSCTALLAGALFTFSKGFDFEEALFLLIITGVLKLSKKEFRRGHRPLSMRAFLVMGSITIVSLCAYVSIGFFNQPYEDFYIPAGVKDVIIKDPSNLAITAIVALLLALLFNVIGFRVLEKKRQLRGEMEE